MRDLLYLLKRYRDYDPSTNSTWEVLLLYPGVKAILLHRLAHFLKNMHVPFLPRMVCELNQFLTGIEIHPGAKIGRGLIIDHGTGTGIGETAVIGDNVTLLQGVALGAVKFERAKRHPTLEDDVFVGVGAKILGNITIGRGAKIGANAVVLIDVPPYATAVGVPAKVIESNVRKIAA